MPTDNATYHHFKGITDWWAENIPNIKLTYLPSHCSFLNAIELLWEDIRTAVTHNSLFENSGKITAQSVENEWSEFIFTFDVG